VSDTPSTGIRLLLVVALSAAVPQASAAQEEGLPTPLTLADVIRVAGQRRDEIEAARGHAREKHARQSSRLSTIR
jgi:hypothetical protein